LQPFAKDENWVHLVDIIARNYGVLPSEVAKLSWSDLMINAKCILAKTSRVKSMMKKQGKKGMIFPTISVDSLTDLM
tara:strand:- start:1248 stop:1478 length:231 start_codon:yes stop_codon:yes gene_type:complete